MNTLMYEHPLTAEHLKIVREVIGYQVVGPISKALACGDIGEQIFESVGKPSHTRVIVFVPDHFVSGIGAMTEWRDIVQIVVDRFKLVRKADSG